jgi:hypothetical protein
MNPNGWTTEDHLCARCLSPVESRLAMGRRMVRCTVCMAEGVGEVSAVCACGVVRGPVGLRCVLLSQPVAGSSVAVVEVALNKPAMVTPKGKHRPKFYQPMPKRESVAGPVKAVRAESILEPAHAA